MEDETRGTQSSGSDDADAGDCSDEDAAENNQADDVSEGRMEWRIVDEDDNDITDQCRQNIHAIVSPALPGIQVSYNTLRVPSVSNMHALLDCAGCL